MRTVRSLLSALAALVVFCGCAIADTLPLNSIGIRYESVTGERCLTRDNLDVTAEAVLGLNPQTALELMRAEGGYLLIYAPDYQVTLCVSDAPTGITARDISELKPQERDSLIEHLKREYADTDAYWVSDMPDYALTKSVSGGGMPLGSLTMSTLYLGKLYGFRLDVVGRELNDADAEKLRSVVGRALRLGAANGALSGASGSLMIEEPPVLSDENAAMTLNNTNVRLSAAPVPAVVGTNQLTLSGETDPQARLRVKVNGDASAAFTPDENGAYTYLARGLRNGSLNIIEISASIGELSSVLSFGVTLDWQQTPLAVSPLTGFSYSDVITIEGLTLPGTEVQVVKGGSTISATADENGLFSFPLYTKKTTGYGYTVRALYPGYKRTELVGKIRRVDVDDALKAAQRIAYDGLQANPARYADVTVRYSGVIEALYYEAGTPKCKLNTADGSAYALICPDLLNLRTGDDISFIGVLRGANGTLGGDAREYPEVTLVTILNNPDQQDGV